MKDLGKFKLFGLLIFLSVVLVFAGVNFLEGKKPGKKPPKWDWKVGIPNFTEAVNGGLNVYGNSLTNSDDGYAVFEENDFVDLSFNSSEDSNTGGFTYRLWLKIYNTNRDIDEPGDYTIGFHNLAFGEGKTYCNWFYEGDPPCPICFCCVFPSSLGCVPVPCYPGNGCTGFNCLEPFMNGYDHPSWGYEFVVMRMYVYCDHELVPGELVTTEARMWQFDIRNTTAPLLEGNDDYHNIYHPYNDHQLEGVTIERSVDGNTWTVFVNQDGSDPIYKTILFREFYYQGVKKEKGKSGKYVLDSEDRNVLGARTPFKFISRWTRF